ncbi:MAG: hypothetical protein PHR83_04280 [Paludibacter sp.]|nr:hypothetical protein [Paludibacter sp.]
MAILYSPIGTPGDYSSLYYYSVNPGVQFQGGIANAPSVYSSVDYNEPELILPLQETSQKTIAKATIAGSANSEDNIISTGQINSAPITRDQANSTIGGASSLSSTASRTKTNASAVLTQQGYGFTSLSTDLTSNSTTTKQNTLSGPSGGGTDPGGDPAGPPIPVGDGWVFLLVLAGVYVSVKKTILK